MLDNDELNGIDNDAENDWQFVSLGEQQNFGIKTAGLEDKATACQMLGMISHKISIIIINFGENHFKICQKFYIFHKIFQRLQYWLMVHIWK